MFISLQNSNQPYLYYNLNHDIILLYCYADKPQTLIYGNEYSIKPWKIHYKNLSNNNNGVALSSVFRHHDYGDVIVECNPHIIIKNNTYYLYYNAGFNLGPDTPIIYYLCSLIISDLDFSTIYLDTFSIIHQCFTGTVINNETIVTADQMSSLLKFYKQSQLIDSINLSKYNIYQIYKINKIFNENQYIVTGSNADYKMCSILLDKDFNFLSEIYDNNQESVYKCSLLDNKIAYTVRTQDATIENRKIIISDFS